MSPALAQQTESIYYTASTSADGKSNITLGPYAGTYAGSRTVTLGAFAGQSNTGTGNTFVGYRSGMLTTSGVENVIIGYYTGYANSTGSQNTFLGSLAGQLNSTGSLNTFLGYAAGNVNSTGGQNTFLGSFAGSNNTTGRNNVFIGHQAGNSNTTAGNNVFIGYQTGLNNTTGTANLFMGNAAGIQSNGSYNLFIGNGSGYNNISGLGNTFIGDGSGYGSTTGQNNTYIGRAANYTGNGGGNYNTFIGFGAGTNGPTVNNATAIGVNAIVTVSNSVILGAPGSKVGIGNSAPQNKLEITQGIANQSGLRLTNLTSSSPASVTNQYKFLTVNSAGDVVLGSINSSVREGVSESLWQRSGTFLQSAQNAAVIIGSNVAHTPSGYKLFVEEGILTEKVKVAVKNTSEWSDYVFDATYRLKDLPEVERYVRQHGHLPGVPSAKDVVKQGIDVAKMDATLLAKIEELTLYSIQLEKTNQSQEDKLLRMEKKDQQQQAEIDELKRLVNQLLEKK
ncbi:hypothetical protein GCM10027592_23640 [Spirosoma flavus]